MCQDLILMEGGRIVREIETTAAAIEFFGAEHVRFSDGSPLDLAQRHDYCLCPVDVEHLLKATGYRAIPHDDPRWDPVDIYFEKAK